MLSTASPKRLSTSPPSLLSTSRPCSSVVRGTTQSESNPPSCATDSLSLSHFRLFNTSPPSSLLPSLFNTSSTHPPSTPFSSSLSSPSDWTCQSPALLCFALPDSASWPLPSARIADCLEEQLPEIWSAILLVLVTGNVWDPEQASGGRV
jgi:hypothetical protein